MSADPGIPAGPSALTPEWLTRALRSTGAVAGASVTSCRVELFGEGKGFSGQLARVGLRYDVAEAGAPASMVAKFQLPHPDPDIRAAVFQSRAFASCRLALSAAIRAGWQPRPARRSASLFGSAFRGCVPDWRRPACYVRG